MTPATVSASNATAGVREATVFESEATACVTEATVSALAKVLAVTEKIVSASETVFFAADKVLSATVCPALMTGFRWRLFNDRKPVACATKPEQTPQVQD